MGGAGAPPATGGVKSMLAFWAGGAGAGTAVAPTPAVVRPTGAPWWVHEFLRRNKKKEDLKQLLARLLLLID